MHGTPSQAIEIWLDRKGHKKQRFFDPYTGRIWANRTPTRSSSWPGFSICT